MIKHQASGLHILAAPQRPEQADKLSVQQFSDVLEALRRMYSYVVLDTSSYLNDVTLVSPVHSGGALLGMTMGLAWAAIVGIAYRQRAFRGFSGVDLVALHTAR